MSRDKGARGERELFHLLSDHLGLVVTRNLTQTRDAGCDSLSVPGFTIECKRVESAFQSAWMRQAVEATRPGHDIPLVFYRASRHPWRVAFRTADLIGDPSYMGIAHLDFDDAVLFIREKLNPDMSRYTESRSILAEDTGNG